MSISGTITLNRPEDGAGPAAPPNLTGLPRDADGPVFAEPWQAQAFALTLALHADGRFTWTEWADALAAEIARARAGGDSDDGTTYYRHWLAALERLAVTKGLATGTDLAECKTAWEAAYRTTPHGLPVELPDSQ